MFYARAVPPAKDFGADAVIKAGQTEQFDGFKGRGLTVRAFDGQMNAPAYVGEVNFDPAYPFPTMKNVEKFEGAPLMFSEDTIKAMRDAAR